MPYVYGKTENKTGDTKENEKDILYNLEKYFGHQINDSIELFKGQSKAMYHVVNKLEEGTYFLKQKIHHIKFDVGKILICFPGVCKILRMADKKCIKIHKCTQDSVKAESLCGCCTKCIKHFDIGKYNYHEECDPDWV
ncbi:hypothetical protein JTB14_026268 [Gonioctena quinquepunctata]|nr:hypothetical protein JTB14_026268 [Gonioctena quinquepunctata]